MLSHQCLVSAHVHHPEGNRTPWAPRAHWCTSCLWICLFWTVHENGAGTVWPLGSAPLAGLPGVRCQSLVPHWDQGVLCSVDGWTTFCLLLRPLMDMWDFPLLGCSEQCCCEHMSHFFVDVFSVILSVSIQEWHCWVVGYSLLLRNCWAVP